MGRFRKFNHPVHLLYSRISIARLKGLSIVKWFIGYSSAWRSLQALDDRLRGMRRWLPLLKNNRSE